MNPKGGKIMEKQENERKDQQRYPKLKYYTKVKNNSRKERI